MASIAVVAVVAAVAHLQCVCVCGIPPHSFSFKGWIMLDGGVWLTCLHWLCTSDVWCLCWMWSLTTLCVCVCVCVLCVACLCSRHSLFYTVLLHWLSGSFCTCLAFAHAGVLVAEHHCALHSSRMVGQYMLFGSLASPSSNGIVGVDVVLQPFPHSVELWGSTCMFSWNDVIVEDMCPHIFVAWVIVIIPYCETWCLYHWVAW